MIEIDENNFEEAKKNSKLLIIDFWASWCGPCKMLSGTLDEIEKEYPNIIFAKCNIEENEDLVDKLGIRNLPTLLFYKEGEIVDRISGAQSKLTIKERIDNSIL